MKYLRRFSLVSLCLVLLFGAFSVTASAEELDHKSYYIYTVARYDNLSIFGGMHYPKDSTRQNFTENKTFSVVRSGTSVTLELYVANNDKTPLYNKGDSVTGKLENLYIDLDVTVPNIATYPLNMNYVSAYLLYSDGTSESFTCSIVKDRYGYYVLDYSFEGKKDVSQLYFIVGSADLPSTATGKSVNIVLSTGEPTTATEPNNNIIFGNLYSDVESPEVGWLAKIWNKLTSGFNDMVDAITGLPSKLWGLIEDGLKDLFVPDSSYISNYKDKWTALLSERLGAVWQVVEVTFGAWEEIGVADNTDSVDMPRVTIPLPDNVTFAFGGYNVKVVPSGFEFLADSLKLITSIACTFMFINGIRKRYDEIMGVEQ